MSGDAKGKGARGPRAAKPDDGKGTLNLRMDKATILLLKHHALDAKSTTSDIVAELVRAHIKPRSRG